jgi:GNAT superfamily N-acetyltransferase
LLPAPEKRDHHTFSIRKAAPQDINGILECLHAAFLPYRPNYTDAAYQDTVLNPDTLRARMNSMWVLVAVNQANRVVGTIACEARRRQEGHLRGMAVLPEKQGSAIAQALLLHAESELRRLGCRRITLDTVAPLKRAMRFYERNGFRQSGIVADFFGMPLYEYSKKL